MRKRTGDYNMVYRTDDPITGIGYKIIFNRPKGRYEIYTQYHVESGKPPLRNRITIPEVKKREHDLESLIDLVENHIVKNHLRFYKDKVYLKTPVNAITAETQPVKGATKYTRATRTTDLKPVSVDSPEVLPQGEKTRQIELLFDEWKKAQQNEPDSLWDITNGGNANITKMHFRSDGIIDEDTFNQEKRKVLFISSEANDNNYSAKTDLYPSSIKDYRDYHKTRMDDYRGKMKERLAELYKVVTRTERAALANPDAVMHFAFMDINKRGGSESTKTGDHIEAYCSYYREYIRREIDIISPDVVIIVGIGLYKKSLHTKYLGAVKIHNNPYFIIGNKKVPILGVNHTAFRFGTENSLEGYEDDKISGANAAKCLEEMKRFGLL